MAYPVQPFSLRLVPGNLLSPMDKTAPNRGRNRPDLFGELRDRQAQVLQDPHTDLSMQSMLLSALDFNFPPGARF